MQHSAEKLPVVFAAVHPVIWCWVTDLIVRWLPSGRNAAAAPCWVVDHVAGELRLPYSYSVRSTCYAILQRSTCHLNNIQLVGNHTHGSVVKQSEALVDE